MFKRGLFTIFLIAIIVFPIVSAVETNLEIKTSADYGLVVRILDPNTKAITDSIYGKANSEGVATMKFETSRPEVAFTIITVYNSETVKTVQTESYLTGDKISIDILDSPVVQKTQEIQENNITDTAEAPVVEKEKTESDITTIGLTGKVINLDTLKSGKNIIYVVVIVLLVAILFFFIMKKTRKIKEEKNIVNTIQTNQENKKKSLMNQLEDAEGRLKEAKKEIDEIREVEKRRALVKLEKIRKMEESEKETTQNNQPQRNVNNNTQNQSQNPRNLNSGNPGPENQNNSQQNTNNKSGPENEFRQPWN